MKKTLFKDAIQQFKQAKSLSERIAATASLINQTAYQTSKALYQSTQKNPVRSTAPLAPPATVNPMPEPELSNDNTTDLADSVFGAKLAQFEQELKELHLARSQTELETEKNVLHFKILQLERQRREFIQKNA